MEDTDTEGVWTVKRTEICDLDTYGLLTCDPPYSNVHLAVTTPMSSDNVISLTGKPISMVEISCYSLK